MSGLIDVSEALRTVRVERLLRASATKLKPPQPCSRENWPPNYDSVLVWRKNQLDKFEFRPELIESAKAYYKEHSLEWINHWVDLYEPRNVGKEGKLTRFPFIMFPKQVEMLQFLLSCLKDEQPGLIEKSRDMGATWIGVAFSVWLWLFWPSSQIGWGSATQPKVDKLGDPDSIFEKIRMMIRGLPEVFLPQGLEPRDHLTFMRCINPSNGSVIKGEIGDNIGRGGRTLLYMKDESSHYEHPELIEASLGDTTRVPIDMSSVNGPGNLFHRTREGGIDWYPGAVIPRGKTRVLVMDWRDHPDKTEEWYAERRRNAEDKGTLHLLAQEVDRNYTAALAGVIIPNEWVKASIDAHLHANVTSLEGWHEGGPWGAALDVADEGGDRNALSKRQGVVLRFAEEWGARDPGVTARRAVAAVLGLGALSLQYDCIGVGAAVKAETNRLMEEKDSEGKLIIPKGLQFIAWNAGSSVLYPNARVNEGDLDSPKNKDFYANLKAQAWWELRNRFLRTYQVVTQGVKHDPDTLISLDSKLPLLRKIEKELSQATASKNSRLKLLVDKSPDGTVSPNLADSIVMNYWPVVQPTFMLGMGPKVFKDGEVYDSKHPDK